MKKIKINDKEYEINCTAYTRFEFNQIFHSGIFAEVGKIQKFARLQNELYSQIDQKAIKEKLTDEEVETLKSEAVMSIIDDFLDAVEKLTYIFIYSANKNIGSFEDWLSSIDKIDISEDWISEVTEFAVASF